MISSVGRADLVRLLGALPPGQAAGAARLLGYEAPAQVPRSPARPSEGGPGARPDAGGEERPRAMARLSYWRMERMTFAEATEVGKPPPPPPGQILKPEDLVTAGSMLFTQPVAPLAPWPRLWPVLRRALQSRAPGRRLDMRALVRAFCNGRDLRRLPRVARRAWSGSASIWVDRSPRLGPFWPDQDELCARLRRVCGSGVSIRFLVPRIQARAMARGGDLLGKYRPDPLAPVLVLGDLGAYDGDPGKAAGSAWLRTARRLRREGVQASALFPGPRSRLRRRLARTWSVAFWERGRGGAQGGTRDGPEPRAARAQQLLRLLSPAAFVQPGLLRALRRLLPAHQADAGTEVDVWNHGDVLEADAGGLILRPKAALLRRNELAQDALVEPGLRKRAIETIQHWHSGFPTELVRIQRAVWHALAPGSVSPEDLADTHAFVKRLVATMEEGEADPEVASAIRHYGRVALSAMPSSAYNACRELAFVFVAVHGDSDGVEEPEGVDLPWDRRPPPPVASWWAMRQVGTELVFSRAPANGAWPSHETGAGSPVAWLLAKRPQISVRGDRGTSLKYILRPGLSLPLAEGHSVHLKADLSEVTLRFWRPESEPWVVASGRDRWGLWADAEWGRDKQKKVVQRFRWIPPGRFWMGSPESEEGRWDDEGPRHQVTWTEGRWLAETPVTQALWDAVIGNNPGRFGKRKRKEERENLPVESVSWDDCQGFVGRLTSFRLPTEAEWEYACRAGTESATWLEKPHPEGLDSIAWYSANAEGTTHPVGLKAPNPFGLRDMLGNVWEWCEDMCEFPPDSYDPQPVVDPPASSSGSARVIRGGSWSTQARFVRAAFRYWSAPGFRYVDLGLRLLRGQEGKPAKSAGQEQPGPRSGPASPGEDTE